MEVIASEFARMAGVSAMAVSSKIKNGTLIRNSAGRLDTDNPVNRAYLERKQEKMRQKLAERTLEATATGNAPASPAPHPAAIGGYLPGERGASSRAAISADDMLRLPLGQLVRQFSTVDNIEKYSKILRDLSAADEREQKTQERRLVQIPKDFVTSRMFGFLEQLMQRLLDVPEAVADQVIAVTLAGGDGVRVSVQRILSDNISKCIAGAKERIVGELSALKGKYDSDESREQSVKELVAEALEG